MSRHPVVGLITSHLRDTMEDNEWEFGVERSGDSVFAIYTVFKQRKDESELEHIVTLSPHEGDVIFSSPFTGILDEVRSLLLDNGYSLAEDIHPSEFSFGMTLREPS